MKFLYISFLSFFLLCMTRVEGHSAILNTEERNDSLFRIVKNMINAQNADSIYALLGDGFKAKFSKDQFTSILKNNLYPHGTIGQTFFLTYKDGTSSYKAICKEAILEFRISTDTQGKISGFRFLPYKEPVATKNYTVATDNPMKTALDSQVDFIARQYINKVNTVGLSIGILKEGRETIYGYGTTAKDNHQIPGAGSIYEIGSITKTFTATLLAYYVLNHQVSLSDPITKYLPDSVATNKNLQGITLQMLSNHTSGLTRMPDNLPLTKADMMNPYKSYSKEKLFAYLKDCKLESTPGEKYAYSNLAVGLLGTILERVSGLSYEQMVKTIICQPLGMTSTYQHPDKEQTNNQVAVHNGKGDQIIMWDMDALAGAGSIRSTIHDMLLYAHANVTRDTTLLSRAIELTHKITSRKEMAVGLGWHLSSQADDVYFHSGLTGGCSTNITIAPEKHIAVVVLSNSFEDTEAVGESIFLKIR